MRRDRKKPIESTFPPDLRAMDPRNEKSDAPRLVLLFLLGAASTLLTSAPVMWALYKAALSVALKIGVVYGWIPYTLVSLRLVVLARLRDSVPLRRYALGMICSALALHGPLMMVMYPPNT